ncbi:hypothetical protein V8B97DRAFT_82515 [Scleroderma yunnanense]
MATAHHPSRRASLLNGLRTGGVRSTSMSAPHTAAPGGSFNIPRFVSTSIQQSPFEEEDLDQVSDLFSRNLHIQNNTHLPGTSPFSRQMTSAVDVPNNGFMQQQIASQKGLNPNSAPFSPTYSQSVQQQQVSSEIQAYQQMQLMQLEIMRLQNAQLQRNQQVQAAVLAEALRQQAKRGVSSMNPPATAGPATSTFDIRPHLPARRPSQAELLKAQLGVSGTSHQEQTPMTATLGGRYGTRIPSSSIAFPTAPEFPESCSPPKQTTVFRGGMSIRSSPPPHEDIYDTSENVPSKPDAAISWRRGNTTNSVLGSLRTVSAASPCVKITPPPGERISPPLAGTSLSKLRPRPLSFMSAGTRNIPIVAVDPEHDDAMSSASSTSLSIPATPSSSLEAAPLSPREEAAKKLYEGLGFGRPVSSSAPSLPPALSQRLVSQPVRQPRGPPSGADELGPKNFASRIRRQAIGGLNVLMDARERRESIEVY